MSLIKECVQQLIYMKRKQTAMLSIALAVQSTEHTLVKQHSVPFYQTKT